MPRSPETIAITRAIEAASAAQIRELRVIREELAKIRTALEHQGNPFELLEEMIAEGSGDLSTHVDNYVDKSGDGVFEAPAEWPPMPPIEQWPGEPDDGEIAEEMRGWAIAKGFTPAEYVAYLATPASDTIPAAVRAWMDGPPGAAIADDDDPEWSLDPDDPRLR